MLFIVISCLNTLYGSSHYLAGDILRQIWMGFEGRPTLQTQCMGFKGRLASPIPSLRFEWRLTSQTPSLGFEWRLTSQTPSMEFEERLTSQTHRMGFEGRLASQTPSMGYERRLTSQTPSIEFEGKPTPRLSAWGLKGDTYLSLSRIRRLTAVIIIPYPYSMDIPANVVLLQLIWLRILANIDIMLTYSRIPLSGCEHISQDTVILGHLVSITMVHVFVDKMTQLI